VKEIADILAAWRQNPAAVLATVVRVEGSAYRRPGARMLILGDGQTIGSVSGGCLERDVVYRAGAVAAGGEPVVVKYDSVSEEEAGPAASLGCGGTVEVLIESAAGALGPPDHFWSRRRRGVIASVIGRQNADVPLGCIAAMDEDEEFLSPPQHSALSTQHFLLEARSILEARCSGCIRQAADGGWVDLFLELIERPVELILFGAGADAVPLAGLGRSLGWRVTVVDMRSGPASAGRKFDADALVRGLDNVQVAGGAAVVVMNHNWNHDLAVLRKLANADLAYLGVLGPRRRTERLLNRLGGAAPPAERMHYPVGLDIGAETPQEVALAIVAEITSVLRGGAGGSLRDKAGPIHSAGETTCPVAAW
jgi:xanthine dehydrogenase accessory factor